MGIVSRFTDIMSANIGALLKKSEDANADVLLQKYISDAKDNLSQVRGETASVIAQEMSCGRKLNENQTLTEKYHGYAVAAVKSGNDEDAKKFLAYVSELTAKKEELQKAYDDAKDNSEKMREMSAKLQADIEAAAAKMTELQSKLNLAKQQENLNNLNEKFSKDPLVNFDSMFDAVQKRIDKADATAQLNAERTKKTEDVQDLAKKYDGTTTANSSSVEDELAKIKASL